MAAFIRSRGAPHPLVSLFITLALFACPVSAQPVSRLKGRVLTDQGKPSVGADVKIEALYGFAAGPYAGQRTFAEHTNDKGEWSVVGLKSGIWVFEGSAPGQLPDVFALPINLLTAIGGGASGLMLPWQLVMKLGASPSGPPGQRLVDALGVAHANDAARVRELLSMLPDNVDADYLTAAGRIALIARDWALAKGLFDHAVEINAASFGGTLGQASVALVLRDFDTASRRFAAARDHATDKDVQKFLSAAIGDLATIKVR
jgi:hypothetical protein